MLPEWEDDEYVDYSGRDDPLVHVPYSQWTWKEMVPEAKEMFAQQNRTYQVIVRQFREVGVLPMMRSNVEEGEQVITLTGRRALSLTYIKVRRKDGKKFIPWEDMLWIKNKVTNLQSVAVQLVTLDSEAAAKAGECHMWVMANGVTLPFGLDPDKKPFVTWEDIFGN